MDHEIYVSVANEVVKRGEIPEPDSCLMRFTF